ncbi:MAG: adenylate/guanylate cyclase domain-containing protein [Elusimicrobiota bacterium]
MLGSLRRRIPRALLDKLGLLPRWAHILVPALVLAGAVGLWRADSPVLQDLRRWTFDAFQRVRPRAYDPEAPVRIVDIDDESLTRLGQWPWPRTLVARLVRRLGELGAGVIAFDIVFSEPDRTSPAQMARSLAGSREFADLRRRLRTLPDHDKTLGQAFEGAAVVTGFSLSTSSNSVRPASKTGFAFSTKGATDDPKEFLFGGYQGAVANLSVLERAAAGNGSFSIMPDPDGVHRRIPLLYRLGDTVYPSLVAESLRVGQGAGGYKVKVSGGSGEEAFGEWTGITSVKVGYLEVPTDEEGAVLLYDSGHRPERLIPVWRVLEDGFDPGEVEQKIVFIGTSATGLKDQRATPLSGAVPGVEVHAQIAEQIIRQEFLLRPDWADGVEAVYLVVFGLVLMLLMRRVGAAWCALLGGAAIAAAFGISWHAFTVWRWLLDPLYPSGAVFAVYLCSSLITYLRSEAEKKHVRGAFSRYMSPALVEQLAADPARLVLGGEMRALTLMFSDIRGFTAISEQFDPHGLTHFINRYLTPMTEIVLERRGTIDKYMGDCIMAFWNAPLDDPDHAANACRAALEMSARLRALNESWRKEADSEGRRFIPIRAGIGLNSGPCCVGNMGSDQRFDYSVLGDDVNLASRLEGQSKSYGVDIVMGSKTRECAGDFATLELDLIRVKGKTVPVRIYALLGGAETAATGEFRTLAERHAAMIEAYRAQRWDETDALIADCRESGFPLGKLYDLYSMRVEACKAQPPGPDWDGVFTATTK